MIWALLALGFVLGSVPFGYLIAKANGVDIRAVGSGNIGATNVFRVLGRGPATGVFVLDVLKGLIPALAARLLLHSQEAAFACGAAAVIGHSFSPFLGFKGGKGIATGLGMLLGSSPLVAVSAFAVFFFVMAATLIVSLASVASGIGALTSGYLLKDSAPLLYAYGVLAVYILLRHRANLARVKEGTEPRFGQKPGEPPTKNPRAHLICGILGLAMVAIVVAARVLQ